MDKKSKRTLQCGEMEKRFFSFSLGTKEQRAEDGAQQPRIISGYAAVFGQPSAPIWNRFVEYIEKDAFAEADFTEAIACFQHDEDDILARYGKTLTLRVDDKGLYFEFPVPNTTAGNDLYENIRNGNIEKCSFAFTVAEESWTWADEDKGEEYDTRRILKINKVYDISPVVRPAYDGTSVTVTEPEQKTEEDKENDRNINNESECRARQIEILSLGKQF